MSQVFDWIVIGSGPAGQRAAVQAAKLQKNVLIIEKDDWGGACAHRGTIPSKTLKEAALLNDARLENAWRRILDRKDRVLKNETEIIAAQLDRNAVQRVLGRASFVDAHSVRVGDRVFRGEKFLVAVGTRPCRASDFPWGLADLYDSDSLLDLKTFPESVLVIGAGVIGCEYASILARLGAKVTLLDRRAELLRSVDAEITTHLKAHFEELGIELRIGVSYSSLRAAAGGPGVEIEISDEKRRYAAALVCLGRQGNVDGLGLAEIGVKVSDRGLVEVNADYQTSLPHVWAAGDVIGPPALAASSSEQGRLAARHAFGKDCPPFSKLFPYGIYTIPEISSVGAQESDLRQQGVDYVVGRSKYRELARGQILGDEHGLLKLLVSKSDRRILGVHILGTGATELIHIGQTAMHFEATVDFFVGNVFNYPTLAEAYKVAALNAQNQL